MSEAVLVHKVYKKFENPHPPAWMRSTRRTWSAAGASAAPSSVAAVQHVSFRIHPGEIFGIVGPSGSGKSTLIRLIAALLLPDEGQIRVFNLDVVRQTAQARRLINPGTLQASFFKRLSPLDNLLYGAPGASLHSAGLYGAEQHEREARRQGTRLLMQLGLEERSLNQPMGELPRALQQIVSVARAILSRPRLLLLDNPALGLDETIKLKLHAVLCQLRAEAGTTILLTTRDIQEASAVCDRIIFLADGKLTALEPAGMGLLQ
jgi:ABC-2 type transport system ATP-binding protein